MKKTFTKVTAAISALLLFGSVALFTSCEQNADDPTKEETPAAPDATDPKDPAKESPENPEPETISLDDALKAMTDDLIPASTLEDLTLPSSVPGYPAVKITWTSDKTSIISNDGKVTRQAGTGDDTVKLTATLSYNNETKTKEYTVKVPQLSKELSADELLALAADQIEKLIPYTGKYGFETFDLPSSMEIEGKTITITYDKSSAEKISIEKSPFKGRDSNGNEIEILAAAVTKDIFDQVAKLKVTLKYNDVTRDKTITFDIPACTEFVYDYYKWDDATSNYSNVLENETKITFDTKNKTFKKEETYFTENGRQRGFEYSYELLDYHTLLLTTTKIKGYMDDDIWLTIDQIVDQQAAAYREFEKVLTTPPKDYTELFEVVKKMYSSMVTGTITEEMLYGLISQYGGAKGDDAEKQSKVIQAWIQDGLTNLGITEEHTIEDAIAEIKNDFLKDYPNSTVFVYDIFQTSYDTETNKKQYPKNAWINIISIFDNTKAWYEQFGTYRDKNYNYRISGSENYTVINNSSYRGNWNSTFTSYTATKDGDKNDLPQPFTIAVTDNKDGTITISGGILTESVTLNFTPDNISY